MLSNNDGCVVARSQEVRALGVKIGTPWFQLRDLARKHGIVAKSSNYSLYGDMSARMMAVLGRFSAVIPHALLPLVVSRTTYPDLISLPTVVYFLGAYAFGMLLGERLQSMLALVERHLSFLIAVLVISTVGNFLLFLW